MHEVDFRTGPRGSAVGEEVVGGLEIGSDRELLAESAPPRQDDAIHGGGDPGGPVGIDQDAAAGARRADIRPGPLEPDEVVQPVERDLPRRGVRLELGARIAHRELVVHEVVAAEAVAPVEAGKPTVLPDRLDARIVVAEVEAPRAAFLEGEKHIDVTELLAGRRKHRGGAKRVAIEPVDLLLQLAPTQGRSTY